MLCSIIPYSRSFDDTLLTYSIPEEFRPFVQVGSSVQIPWWSDTIFGIVADMGKELPYEGEIKPISGPHCTTPWLSPSEVSLLIQLSRKLFVRLHTVAQLFLPLGVFGLFEKENFLNLVPPLHAPTSSLRIPQGVSMSNTALRKKGESEYIIAPDEAGIKTYLGKTLLEEPGAVILPEWVSVKSWSILLQSCVIDHHPKSITTQKKIYLDILAGIHPVLFGTRRTLAKRLGHYSHLYIVYDNLSSDIVFGQHRIPLWMMVEMLEAHGHIIHYITTTPSVRTLCDFLQSKKTVKYLES